MENSKFEKYLEERYYPQIEWYDRKSTWNQKVYKIFQWIIIILSAITPILVASEFHGNIYIRWFTVVVSALVAIGTASLKTFKYQENWINYRTTCETLRKEIHYFNSMVDDYSTVDDPMALFVKRVEALISQENTIWLKTQKEKAKKSTSDTSGKSE